MEYHITEINLTKGAADRDLVRDDVTFKIHSLAILGDTFRVSVLHIAPQGKKTLEDVVEFEIPLSEVPEWADKFNAFQAEVEKYLIQTIYLGAIEKGMI